MAGVLGAAGWLAGAGAADAASAGPTVIQGATELGPVVPGVFQGDLRRLPRAPEWQPGDPVIERPRRVYPRPPARERAPFRPQPGPPPDTPESPPDQPASRSSESRAFDVPILNFDAATFNGGNPPDTVGDVGPNHYIQLVNHSLGTQVRIYDKSGTLIAGPFILASSLWTLGGPCALGAGDPVVLYDSLADRWLLSEFADAGNRLCVYISQTADPVLGGWFLYEFTTPDFPDYPKYGVWPDAYYVSTNESSPAVYALDRTRMLAGLGATAQRFTGPDLAGFPFQAFTPADLDGATPPPAGAPGIFMRHRDDEVHNVGPNPSQDFLEIWEFHVDFATPANSTFTGPTNIAVSEFSSELCGLVSFNCFPQPGTATTLDPLREVIMFRLQYRNFGTHQTLVGNFVTDADGEGGGDPLERGGIRWFELRKVGAGAWSLFQEGTHSPDANPRWMGAIAMDGSGNIALGYSVSSSSVFPSLRYAGRLASDSPGTLQAEVNLVAGIASNGSNRWGDYAAMSVDPADDCTFWFTSMYSPTSQWRTRIGAFRFPACGAASTPPKVVTGAGGGGGPHVRGFAANGTATTLNFIAYATGFLGGVRVAAGDVNGDGIADIVTAPGPGGGPHIRVFSGANPAIELASFFAYSSAFTGGVYVAVGDVDGDGIPELITGADAGGGPHVRVLKLQPGAPGGVSPFLDFFPFPAGFTGGVRVAAGNVDGSDRASIIVGAGPGGGPHVRVLKFVAGGLQELGSFFAYHPAFTGGVFVAAGNVTGDGRAEVITGPGAGGGPHVRVFTGGGADTGLGFFAYDPAFTGGVRVAAGDVNGDGKADIITGAGPGGAPHVRVFSGANPATELAGFFAYDPSFAGGVFVAGPP